MRGRVEWRWSLGSGGLDDCIHADPYGDTVTFTGKPVPFGTFEPPGIDPDAGPLPIGFAGTLRITGGTGRFASATGSADFDGMYCFRVNGGMYTLSGRLIR